MLLPVHEDAACAGEHGPALAPAQGEREASDARVGTGREQVVHLHPGGQSALQVVDEVPDGHADVGAVAHHQSVDRGALEAVVGPAGEGGGDRGGGGGFRGGRGGRGGNGLFGLAFFSDFSSVGRRKFCNCSISSSASGIGI